SAPPRSITMTADTMASGPAQPWPGDAAAERALAALAARPRGLFSDVDGTLAPIVPMPELAVLLPGVPDTLRRAVGVLPVVAVSGRSVTDVSHLVDIPELVYIGNHGLERSGPQVTPEVRPEARPEVRQDGGPDGPAGPQAPIQVGLVEAEVYIHPDALPYQV